MRERERFETVTVHINTSNIGDAIANESVTTVIIDSDKIEFNIGRLNPLYTDVVWPGEERTDWYQVDTFDYKCEIPGTYIYNVTADATGKIVESNETNNEAICYIRCLSELICEDYL